MYWVEVETRGETQYLHDPCEQEIYDADGMRVVNPNARRIISGTITKVLNAVSDFKFTILYGHPLFDLSTSMLRPFITLVRVIDEKGKIIFRGRLLDPTYKMTSEGLISREYVAEDELAFLLDSMQRHGEYHNITPREYLKLIVDNHNAYVANDNFVDRTFVLGEVNVTNTTDNVYRYLAYKSSLENIKEDLLSSLGGYLSIQYEGSDRILNYLTTSGESQGMSITLAENLISIESQYKPSQIITRLVPLGAEIDSVPDAINRLADAGVITDKSYWLSNYTAIPWLGQLLVNMGECVYGASNTIADVEAAIVFLEAGGVINSADYWRENYSKLSNAGSLLIQAAQKMDTEAGKLTIANASKPRLTVADVNGGKDYIDDDTGFFLEFGIVEGVVTWNDVTVASNLLAKGKAWLESQGVTNSVTLTALDLSKIGEDYDSFQVGNYYIADHELLGIDTEYQLTEQNIDILEPGESTLTFGDKKMTLYEYGPNLGPLG